MTLKCEVPTTAIPLIKPLETYCVSSWTESPPWGLYINHVVTTEKLLNGSHEDITRVISTSLVL